RNDSNPERAEIVFSVLGSLQGNVLYGRVHLVRKHLQEGRQCRGSIVLEPVIIDIAGGYPPPRSCGWGVWSKAALGKIFWRKPPYVLGPPPLRPCPWVRVMKVVVGG